MSNYTRDNDSKRSHDACLDALTIIGRILIFTPLFLGLLSFLYSLLISDVGFVAHEDSAYSSALIFLIGLITLIYVAIKRFQQS